MAVKPSFAKAYPAIVDDIQISGDGGVRLGRLRRRGGIP